MVRTMNVIGRFSVTLFGRMKGYSEVGVATSIVCESHKSTDIPSVLASCTSKIKSLLGSVACANVVP